MNYAGLAVCLALIAFAISSTVASVASGLLLRLFETRLQRLSSRLRERAYLWLRLAPTASGLLFVCLFFVPAFLWLEPRDGVEKVGAKIILVTLAAAVPLLRSAHDALVSRRATRARVAEWLADAVPLRLPGFSLCRAYVVKAPFPVVAVVGIRRPFLVVSRAVIDACSDDELAAILAHEAAHVERRDNLKRLLMVIAPDLLARTALARNLERGWQQASEEFADRRAGAPRALDLAAALVKVARLAQRSVAPPATVSAFCQGGDITRRVVRLTASRAPDHDIAGRSPALLGLTIAAGATLLIASGALHHVHVLTELAVTLLQ